MEQPKWLKFLAVGLILAFLGLSYFLLNAKFLLKKTQMQVPPPPETSIMVASPTPSPTPKPQSAASKIGSRQSLAGAKNLPETGFPASLWAIFSASAIISGWGLRKFPK